MPLRMAAITSGDPRLVPATHAPPGFDIAAVIDAACAGTGRGPPRDRDAGRPGLRPAPPRRGDEPARSPALPPRGRARRRGVRRAGDDLLYPSLEPYRESFAIAAAAGLASPPTRAEAGPATAAVDAVELLGVRRIGHGSHIVDDPAVLAWAAREGIAIEVCLTSNVFTGAALMIAEHPAPPVLAAGRGRRRRQPGQNIGTTLSAEERRLETEVASPRSRSAGSSAPPARSPSPTSRPGACCSGKFPVPTASPDGAAEPAFDPIAAAVHHHDQPGLAGDRGRLPVRRYRLEPEAAGADRATASRGACGTTWSAAEDIDDVERARGGRGLFERRERRDPVDRLSPSGSPARSRSRSRAASETRRTTAGRALEEAPMTAMRRDAEDPAAISRRPLSVPGRDPRRGRGTRSSVPASRRGRSVRAFLDVRLADCRRRDAPPDDTGEHDDREDVGQGAEASCCRGSGTPRPDARQPHAEVAVVAGPSGSPRRAPPRT